MIRFNNIYKKIKDREILSGIDFLINEGDVIVAEGLKKVFPRAKINPIKEGEKKTETDWKKKKIKIN